MELQVKYCTKMHRLDKWPVFWSAHCPPHVKNTWIPAVLWNHSQHGRMFSSVSHTTAKQKSWYMLLLRSAVSSVQELQTERTNFQNCSLPGFLQNQGREDAQALFLSFLPQVQLRLLRMGKEESWNADKPRAESREDWRGIKAQSRTEKQNPHPSDHVPLCDLNLQYEHVFCASIFTSKPIYSAHYFPPLTTFSYLYVRRNPHNFIFFSLFAESVKMTTWHSDISLICYYHVTEASLMSPPQHFDLIRQELLNNRPGEKKNLYLSFPSCWHRKEATYTRAHFTLWQLSSALSMHQLPSATLAPRGLAKQSLVNPKISQAHQEDSKPKISLSFLIFSPCTLSFSGVQLLILASREKQKFHF